MSGPANVAIVTPWYPTRQRPFLGAFVQAMVEATAPGHDRVRLYHCEEWGHRLPPDTSDAVDQGYRELIAHAVHPGRTVGGAELVHLPVPLPVTTDYAAIARRHEETLRSVLGGQPIDAPVVHAHVGLPGGWAALRNARPDARVFVTEHATFLDLVLAQPEARAMYDELLQRCAGVFAVGEAVRRPLVEAFPQHADRVGYLPNPISFDQQRAAPVTALRRWLFVGGLIPRKGVRWLLEAFASCRARDPELTLTFVGEGELRGQLQQRAEELGVADALTFTGAVPPDRALALMREHDLLVHPSRFETFGMTVVEAVAAGLPVLVTRCGGPEETLAGVEDAAAELVDVEEGSEALIAGYWRLRERFDRLDLAGAQRELAARYSYPAVARAHDRVWFSAGDSVADAVQAGLGGRIDD
ncbi:glycosyltransferase family 4 protein [Micromonospora sp. NPDC047740]|uniref:glycosyltransferase family 4 protein n=1 Tax=Micromonospora sp. NPDC047740 TaxID=3364254 RepID=UPI003714D0D7